MTIGGIEFKITRLAFDMDARRILLAISPSAMTVKEMSIRLDIPITKCYRLVRSMKARGMLKQMEFLESDVASYRSNLRSINLRIEHDRLNINVDFTDGGKRVLEFCPRQTTARA